MAKFWFISAPLYSHTDWGGFLKTAQVLQQRGHDVLWLSEPALRSTIEHAEISFQPIKHTGWLWPPPPPPDLSTIAPQDAVNIRYKRALDTWLSEDLVSEATRSIIELADDLDPPNIIATDPFLSASALAAEAISVPLVVCGWPAQASLDETALFPVQKNLGSDSQQRIFRLCEEFKLRGVNFATGPTPSVLSPHLHINYFTESWYASEQDTLLPQNLFVGGKVGLPDTETPQWLSQIPDETALAVITLGSTFTGDLGFFSWAAHAAAREGLLPIVAIGWNPIDPARKQELINALPPGTRLVNWVSFDHVLPRTRLMIHHGGMGTTHQAVAHGVPQIVVPHAADQRIQAKRVAQAKVGLHLNAHDVQQGQLWEGTRALLNSDRVKDAATHLAQEMAALGGVERAAESILAMINNS